MIHFRHCTPRGFRGRSKEAATFSGSRSQFIGKALRTVSLLFFITVMASCPVTPTVLTANFGGNRSVGAGKTVTLDGRASTPSTGQTINSYQWEHVKSGPEEPDVGLSSSTGSTVTFPAPALALTERIAFTFKLTVADGSNETASTQATISVFPIVDADGNGLIEISTLEELHNIRHDLSGRSYKAYPSSIGDSFGCPSHRCIGYELTQSLNFDTEGEDTEDTSTWTGDREMGFTLDTDDANDVYFDVDEDGTGGWLPIGTGHGANSFTATFDGKGNTISNLAIKRDIAFLGLFGYLGKAAVVRNIGLVNNLTDYNGGSNDFISVGGLAGHQDREGSISASYATGTVSGGPSPNDLVGGLVGRSEGSIIASYTTGPAYNEGGQRNATGGLVGDQTGESTIIASYATGNVYGGEQGYDYTGGLIGWQSSENASVIASYATGTVDGGDAAGGDLGSTNYVGALIGARSTGTDTASYGFGNTNTVVDANISTIGAPGTRTSNNLTATAASAGTEWNSAEHDTLNAWDFGTADQAPVLKYADYDGPSGTAYNCDPQGRRSTFPVAPDGTSLCGTIIPGQER